MSSLCRRRVGVFGRGRATRAALFGLALAAAFSSCARRSETRPARPSRQSSQSAQSQSPQQPQPQQSSEVLLTKSPRETHVLRVCADPNNLPFSNSKGEGFENRIAELIAREMNADLEYTWWAQRRGFIRNTLKAGECDVVIEVPASFEMALTTSPYYRSTYVFVYRKDRRLNISSFDDPILRRLKIGVQMIGDDFSNAPPAHALSNRHIIDNVEGFTVYGNYSEQNEDY
ncbi:MAG: transporter substrate-binding domain-containing protein [Acidobacteriota bacterium]|nr:transporter substrate-binding domain-containing protein [Acidobacteriota bacterium]